MTGLPSLPFTRTFTQTKVKPTLNRLADFTGLRQQIASREAVVNLVAIALQESNLEYRRQIGGPARSLWQFEMPTMVAVLRHPKVLALPGIDDALQAFGLRPAMEGPEIANVIEHDDAAACVLARLLLWCSAGPLVLDEEKAWSTYQTTWRPGKPRHDDWAACWSLAFDAYPERALSRTKSVISAVVAAAPPAAVLADQATFIKDGMTPYVQKLDGAWLSWGLTALSILGLAALAFNVWARMQLRKETGK